MSEFIAEAQVAIVPNVAGFAASLRKQVEAAVVAAGPVLIPVAAAPAVGAAGSIAAMQALNIAQEDVAASALGLEAPEKVLNTEFAKQAVLLDSLVVATDADAKALVELGAAATVDAAGQRKAAVAHGQAERAIIAQAASITGLRGAVLTASTPFLLATVAAIAFAKSIKAASDTTEELNKNVVIFGESSKQIEEFAKTTANAIGISEEEALKATGIFGNLFRSIQIGQEPAAQMSQRLVTLAADLASFNNADPSRVLEALRSGLVGQARPLRVFGVFISQARAQQQALIDTGKEQVTQLTNAELVQARYNIILKDSNIAAGDYARTSGELANQTRTLQANLSDLSATIGAVLLPGLRNLAASANDILRIFKDINVVGSKAASAGLQKVGEKSGFVAGQLDEAKTAFSRLLHPGQELAFVLDHVAEGFDKIAGTAPKATEAISGFQFAAGGLRAEIAAMNAVQSKVDLKPLNNQLADLERQRTKIQTGLAPGGRPAEEANLKRQVQLDKQAVAASQARTKERAAAIAALKQDQDDLAALIGQDVSDSESRAQKLRDAANAAKAAAEAAARAQTDAINALAGTFTERSSALQAAISRAASNDNFKKQIALNKAIITNDLKEITALRDRIRHLNLHGEALKAAAAAIKAAQREIQDARDAIADASAARKKAIEDIINQKLDLRIQIAEAQGNVAAELRARRAKLAEITKELVAAKKATGKNSIAWLELKAAQAEEIAAIKELQGQTVEKNKAQQSLFFTFLQTQSGFAANLLGNLIPGFATAGLVGNPATAADPGLRQVPGGFEQPRSAVSSQAALAGSRERGVRPVQVDTTNHLLRQILAAVTGKRVPPEITHNRQRANAAYDTLGAMGD